MSIILVGLNYRTAPVELREKLSFTNRALQGMFGGLKNQTQDNQGDQRRLPVSEMVVLMTCNRLEIYAVAEHTSAGIAFIEQFLAGVPQMPPETLKHRLYRYSDDDAVTHLMRVASGLDSMILGEAQILGQVTAAFEEARAAGMTGAVLSHLFAQAVHTGKRARTETPISRCTTSVSHAGAALLLEKLDSTRDPRVLIVGAGEMAALSAHALARFDVHDMIFINRTHSAAEKLAADFGGSALRWYQLDEALIWADAIICATGAPHPIIYRSDVEALLPQREGRPLLMLDIAVPRDIEDGVGALPGVRCFDIDDLQSVVDSHLALRKAAVPQVEAIIRHEQARFNEWYRSREITPVIRTLRDWAQGIADEELTQALNRLTNADERTRQVISRMAHRLINRLLHEPTAQLRIQATAGNGLGYAHAIRELFALHDAEPFVCQPDNPRCVYAGQEDAASRQCTLQCLLPPGVRQ